MTREARSPRELGGRWWSTGRSVLVTAAAAAVLLPVSSCSEASTRYEVDMQSVTGGSYSWSTNVVGYVLQGMESAPRTATATLSPGENFTVTVDGAGPLLLGQCVIYRMVGTNRTQVFSSVQDYDYGSDGSSDPATCYVTEPLRE